MIKKVKTRKHYRLKIQALATMVLMFSFMLFLLSAVFLRSYNVHLSIEKQNIESEIASMIQDNNILANEIQQLSSKDRVMAIAIENGLSNNQSNITLITKGE